MRHATFHPSGSKSFHGTWSSTGHCSQALARRLLCWPELLGEMRVQQLGWISWIFPWKPDLTQEKAHCQNSMKSWTNLVQFQLAVAGGWVCWKNMSTLESLSSWPVKEQITWINLSTASVQLKLSWLLVHHPWVTSTPTLLLDKWGIMYETINNICNFYDWTFQ